MDQALKMMSGDQGFHGTRINIHDRHGFSLFGPFALSANARCDSLPLIERLGKECRLPCCLPDLLTKVLIILIIGTQSIAMSQANTKPEHLENKYLVDQKGIQVFQKILTQ